MDVPAAAAAKSLQSCPTLCDPIDGSPPGSPVPGILQAWTLEWVAISFPALGYRKIKLQKGKKKSKIVFISNKVLLFMLCSRTWLSDFTFTFHFHALEKEMATHSSVHAWRIPGMGEPDGLPSMRSHRVGHDWSNLAAAAATHTCSIVCNSCGFMDCSPPGSSVHGIFQAGLLKWVAISSCRGSSRSQNRTLISCVSCLVGRFFTTEPPGKPNGHRKCSKHKIRPFFSPQRK